MTDDEYNKVFGLNGSMAGEKKLEEAYKMAWATRNFEIDKLWSRVAYFWGFIAAIFAGYIAVLTSGQSVAGTGNFIQPCAVMAQ
jgi:hypothetical protein